MVQEKAYAQELQDLKTHQEVSSKSSIKSLYPFVADEGLLRVGGRLQHSSLPYGTVHQLILPPNHYFTELVVCAEHLRLLHAGPQLLLASLRRQYWIPRIRNVIKQVIHRCLKCYRLKIHASHQLMGSLPSSRIQPACPFLTTGIDYAGPILLKLGAPRSKTVIKGYIAVFVCFTTKAVHLTAVTSINRIFPERS